ncbi:MAG: DUF434 domain-containing protein [Myxococcales bacterium]|nr:DUF434 domain-containing protein [Myxococcales bacterium]
MSRRPHPDDHELFAPVRLPTLRAAVDDLSWLRGRGYADTAALALVGDRYQLLARARTAVARVAASPEVASARRGRRLAVAALTGRALVIDGFNVLVTCEAALAGGVVLPGRDGAWRDLGSVHGSYRAVDETARALAAIAQLLARAAPARVTWYFDRPVSSSGDVARRVRAVDPAWTVELVNVADPELIRDPAAVVASSDAWVLDRAGAWIDLPTATVTALAVRPWLVELGVPGDTAAGPG